MRYTDFTDWTESHGFFKFSKHKVAQKVHKEKRNFAFVRISFAAFVSFVFKRFYPRNP